MKKLISLVLAALMALTLFAACGKSDGDLAGVDLCDLLDAQVGDLVFGVNDDRDAVECEDGLFQAGCLLVILKCTPRAAFSQRRFI